MPNGPQGQWRPAAPVAAGVHIGRLATHEIEEIFEVPPRPDPVSDSRRASKAARARAASMTPEQRRASAKRASDARWNREAQP